MHKQARGYLKTTASLLGKDTSQQKSLFEIPHFVTATNPYKEVLTKITDMLNLHGFNTDPLYGAKDIANAIAADKKRSSGHINLILIRDIGKCTIEKTDMSDLTDIIQTATEYRG